MILKLDILLLSVTTWSRAIIGDLNTVAKGKPGKFKCGTFFYFAHGFWNASPPPLQITQW